jgi:hypothetical protein
MTTVAKVLQVEEDMKEEIDRLENESNEIFDLDNPQPAIELRGWWF